MRHIPFVFLAALSALPAAAADYRPIAPTMEAATVTLTGKNLTVEQVLDIARRGAKVALSPEAKKRSEDAYGLLLEAAAEGISIYGFNRGSGAQRENVTFAGDPNAPENKPGQIARQKTRFEEEGPTSGYGPEVAEEETVRAVMAVRANNMSYEAASPALTQMLLDLLNKRVTPVVWARGSVGEGDLAQMHNIAATMVGMGDAYYKGKRMSAADALKQAGLKPLEPSADDNFRTLTSTDAFAAGVAVLLVDEARRALEWADLIYAMDLNGMNSSITPMAMPVQTNHPFKWVNWDAARVLDMLKGSYLFGEDKTRIIQDPESLRAGYARQGSAWQAWGALRDTVLIQINSSDHNPAVRPGLSPTDSWELSTPQLMKYYVKGGKYSNGQHGYILSNASWDPYPMANQIEALSNAFANMDVAITQRMERFSSTFFTVVKPSDVLPPGQGRAPQGGGSVATAIWQEIQALALPLAPEGNPISATVEEMQGQTPLKLTRARQLVSATVDLLGQDLLTGAFWMDIRKLQDGNRNFGDAPTAAWTAFRKALPLHRETKLNQPPGVIAAAFMHDNPAATFYPAGPAMPAGEAR